MNKTELIKAMAEKAGMTQADARKAFEAFTATIAEEMKKKEKVVLPGFGTFSVHHRDARMGVNPLKKGEKIQIAAKDSVKFKAGKDLTL